VAMSFFCEFSIFCEFSNNEYSMMIKAYYQVW
jgi:hypothetical protein